MVDTAYQVEAARVAGSPVSSWRTFAEETHEENPDLVWPKSIDVFDRMRREDAQVASVVRAVTLPIRKARWLIDPAGARDEVVDLVAGDLGLPVKGRTPKPALRTRSRFTWREHLPLALLELVFGHSFFQQVYDQTSEPGRAHLHKLLWIPPRTISRIDIERDGGLKAVAQHGIGTGTEILVPVEHLVAYVNEREGGNWLGQSLLRSAYKNALLKDRMLRTQALMVERNGMGVPTYTGAPAPDGAELEDAKAWHESERNAGLELAKGARSGETAGASLPHGATLEFKGVSGKLPDIDGPIRYHDEQIARAVLAHFLNLGTETGSWALGSTFANFFTDSLNAVAEHIADVTQQHVIEDLVDANWGTSEPAPRIICEPIGAELPATAEAIRALIDSGAISNDPTLEAHLRQKYGLPPRAAREESGGVSLESAREAARAQAEIVQKLYLGIGPLLTQPEGRRLLRAAGIDLDGDAAAAPASTDTTTSEEAA